MNLDELLNDKRITSKDASDDIQLHGGQTKDLETILGIIRKINTSLVLEDVLALVLDEAIRITRADRGFLMLADSDRRLRFAVGRDAIGAPIREQGFQVSSSVLDDVFTTGESLCVENALHDERFEQRESIMSLELQTILCSPLRTHDETIGVIYVDSKHIQDVDKADILSVFEILAGQAAIAIKNARLYKDLKATYDELKSANRQIIEFERMAMKGEIAAEISHELKNLVAVVLLNLQKLQLKVDAISVDEIRAIVDSTIDGARKIQGFSQSLLTRSRASAKLLPEDLNTIVRNFADFVRSMPKFKQATLKAEVAENLPRVDLDIDQIQQVLLNLVNNAVEASSQATIEMTTLVRNEDVLLQVRDNGPGIAPEILGKLFKEKITTKVDGHGYGMPICKEILENHGGSILVESKHGEGTMFMLRFPVGKSSK